MSNTDFNPDPGGMFPAPQPNPPPTTVGAVHTPLQTLINLIKTGLHTADPIVFGRSPATATPPPAPTPTTPPAETPATPPAPGQQRPGDTDLLAPHPVATVTAPTPKEPAVSQRFVPTATRGWRHWGTPSWAAQAQARSPFHFGSTSMMPSPQESPWVIAGAGKQLATWGSPGVRPLAQLANMFATIAGPFLDFYGQGKFSQNYNAEMSRQIEMRRDEMEMNRQRMVDASYQTWQASKAHSDVYRDILFKIHNNFYSKNMEVNQRLGYQAFLDAARTDPNGRDDILIQQAQNGGLSAAEAMIDQRDAKAHDMYLSAVSMDNAPSRSGTGKSKEDTELANSVGPAGSGVGTGALPGPGGEPTAAAASAPLGGPESDSGNRTLDDELAKRHNLYQGGVEDAHSMYRGEKPRNMTGGQYNDKIGGERAARVKQASDDIQTAIRNEASGSDDQQDKIDKITGIDEEAGSQAEGLLNGDFDPNKPEHKKWTTLAKQINPNWSEQQYKNKQDFTNTKGTANILLRKASGLGQAHINLQKAIDALPDNVTLTQSQVQAMLAGVSGDPRFNNIGQALRPFAAASVNLTMGTNAPRVSLITSFLEKANPVSKAQLQYMMKTDDLDSKATIDGLLHQWKALGITKKGEEDAPPGFDDHNYNIVKAGALMNDKTGEYPSGDWVPDDIKVLSRKPGPNFRRTHPWIKDDWELAPPPSSPEDYDMYIYAQSHPEDPRSADILRHQGNRYTGTRPPS